jgi:predicted aspartyl protease
MGRACRVLVDCGCSGVVMSSEFARRLGLSLRSDVSLAPVTLANGSQQPVTWTTQAVPFWVGSAYSEDLHFTVTDVTYDVIMGNLPWLESENKPLIG